MIKYIRVSKHVRNSYWLQLQGGKSTFVMFPIKSLFYKTLRNIPYLINRLASKNNISYQRYCMYTYNSSLYIQSYISACFDYNPAKSK